MLKEADIDKLMLNIQSGRDAFVYYIAHNVECREGIIDELSYKSIPRFRVLKLKVNNIYNAYFELLKYYEHPENYYTEQEETYPDFNSKYIYYYTVPNEYPPFDKAFNPRVPSVIFGTRRIQYESGIMVGDYSDPSPIKEVYTNALKYGDLGPSVVAARYAGGDLDWKYKDAGDNFTVDGIVYRYLTSDWFILDIDNFPRTEMPLVNIKQKTAYFMTNEAAQYYVQELMA